MRIEEIQEEVKAQAINKANQIIADYFEMFSASLEYEQQVMMSSSTNQEINTVYDPDHAQLTQREIFRKLIAGTHLSVETSTDNDGFVKSKIHINVDEDIDFRNEYVQESFQMMLDNVKTRMHFNIN